MKLPCLCLVCGLLLALGSRATAATHYVDVNSPGPVAPYATWATASTDIQDAIDAANPGDLVLVTNGVYQTGARAVTAGMSNRVVIDQAITVQSVNGPSVTIIQGYQVPGTITGVSAIRCAFLTNGAMLAGFTLTNGATQSSGSSYAQTAGGGVWSTDTSSVVSNCVIIGNMSSDTGGGAYGSENMNIGQWGALFVNCVFQSNQTYWSGGGASGCTLRNCYVTGNLTTSPGGGGAGLVNGHAFSTTMVGNTTLGPNCGGAYNCNMTNCIIYGNIGSGTSNYNLCTLSYCDTAPLASGTGNISADPQFADLPHLLAGSPCIGAGSSAYVSGVDLDGEAWSNPPSIGCEEYVTSNFTGPLSVAIQATTNQTGGNQPISLSAIISGQCSGFAWDFGDGTQTSNALAVSHAWAIPGNYSVVLTAFNASYPGGVSATDVVQVVPPFIHYVNLGSTKPLSPFTNWASAATNIQDAIDAANPGDLVLVTNGVYQTGARAVTAGMSNRVVIDQAITVQSVNGPSVTIIQGYQVPGTITGVSAIRCAFLTNGAMLAGFTLTNGATQSSGSSYAQTAGGGVWSTDTSSVVSNCVIIGNMSSDTGGGAYGSENMNIGQWGALFVNCVFQSNQTYWSGGGASGCTLRNCYVTGNLTTSPGGGGAGLVNGHAFSTTMVGNTTLGPNCGGAYNCNMTNCIIYGNIGSGTSNYNLCTLSYCDTAPLASGTGNISADPQFADLPHLLAGSPCIGAGSSAYVSGVDLDGEAWSNPPSIGCEEYVTSNFTGPLSVAIQATTNPILTNEPVSLTASISGRCSGFAWDFGDGTQTSNVLAVAHAWTIPGNYSVVLTAFNASYPGGVSATNVVQVVNRFVHFVALQGTSPVAPYLSWTTAATNIQDAVDAAVAGDVIMVSNGVYQTGGRPISPYLLTNRVAITTPVTVQSVNGPGVTVIQGYLDPVYLLGDDAVRCVYLTNGASLIGFTLADGATREAGDVTHEQCGGAIWCESSSAVVSNCVVDGNVANASGGDAFGGTLNNCTLENGSAYDSGGGASSSTLHNCLISDNSAFLGGSGVADAILDNCTVVNNTCFGGVGGGAYSSTLYNSIVYFNSGGAAGNYAGCTLNNCCTTPLAGGPGNISTAPQLLDAYHLASNSPCIGAGSSAYASGVDLDGKSWATPPSIGCDEYYPIAGPLSVSFLASLNPAGTNTPVAFAAGVAGRCSALRWDFGDGNQVSNQLQVSHFWPVAGSYPVVLTAFSDSNPGGVSATNMEQIFTNPSLVHCVSLTSTNPLAPYSTWATAATNIQDAVDVASPGDLVYVTNGVYASGGRVVSTNSLTNRVAVTGPITVQSVNGPLVTIIQGYQMPDTTNGPSAIRCMYLTNGAALVGFTLTNGATLANYEAGADYLGGGVFSPAGAALVSNCVISGNTAYIGGGGASDVVLANCTLANNSTVHWGGGAYNCSLANCVLTGNLAVAGGGSYLSDLSSCLVEGNSAEYGGGASWGTLSNSRFIGNQAAWGGGVWSCTLMTNCTLIANSATTGGGGASGSITAGGCLFLSNSAPAGGGADSAFSLSSYEPFILIKCTFFSNSASVGGALAGSGYFTNCLLAGNSASLSGGGAAALSASQTPMLVNCILSNNSAVMSGGGSYESILTNCLLIANLAGQGGGSFQDAVYSCTIVGNVGGGTCSCTNDNSVVYSNSPPDDAGSTFSFCCTPLPEPGPGNFTNNPLFVNPLNGNFRLQSNSPCINAGNNAFVVGATDLDGNPRISGGTVDMGAYEYQNPASTISYAWLQQYGLATDGSADLADTDGNRMNNWQKWVAGLNPTNAASVLQVLNPVASGTNLVVTWQSVTNINYFLQRSLSLAPGSFQTIVTNIAGQAGTTSYTDTNAPAPGPWFYRVGVPWN